MNTKQNSKKERQISEKEQNDREQKKDIKNRYCNVQIKKHMFGAITSVDGLAWSTCRMFSFILHVYFAPIHCYRNGIYLSHSLPTLCFGVRFLFINALGHTSSSYISYTYFPFCSYSFHSAPMHQWILHLKKCK